MVWLHRMWQWLCERWNTPNIPTTPLTDDKKKKRKSWRDFSLGKVLWSGKYGSYQRGTRKIGRNEPCPCGAMRVAPRDVTKPNKAKWCCRKGTQ